MKTENLKIFITVFVLAGLFSCKQVYIPPVIATNASYLVVEGVINSGADSTIIKLSHTVRLDSTTTTAAEINAQVTVESDQNKTYPLYGTGNGSYISPGLNLPASSKYRLRIKTGEGKEYLSDYEAIKNAPPIDSISFRVNGSQLGINVNTHDPSNQTRYYRWSYTETYEYHSTFYSEWKSNGDTVLLRDQVNDEIYTCWRGDASTSVITGSSAKLANDVISQAQITYIPSTSEKIYVGYSMLLKQYALTPEAYNFWENLKKNTEQLGSIFDAQPSQIKGNIHSTTNPTESVIGFVSVGSFSSKRVLIFKRQLPYAWQIPGNDCLAIPYLFHFVDQDGKVTNQENQAFNYNKGATFGTIIPTSAIVAGTTVVGHFGSDPECVDCTLRGTNVRPSYWPTDE